MSSSKKIDLERYFAPGVYRSESPPPWFLFGVVYSNFVCSESGQIQNVKLLQIMVSNRTQHPSHPLPATDFLYILYFDTETGEGGELNQREG
jgi:hypothetical protein